MRLSDGHLVRIPHEAVKRRRPSGRRIPLYKKTFENSLRIPLTIVQMSPLEKNVKKIKFFTISKMKFLIFRAELFCSLSSGSLKNCRISEILWYFVSCYLNLIATHTTLFRQHLLVDQLVDQFLEWLTLMTHKMKQNFWIERLYFEKEQFTEILKAGYCQCIWSFSAWFSPCSSW